MAAALCPYNKPLLSYYSVLKSITPAAFSLAMVEGRERRFIDCEINGRAYELSVRAEEHYSKSGLIGRWKVSLTLVCTILRYCST